jgi:hypothetical protein
MKDRGKTYLQVGEYTYVEVDDYLMRRLRPPWYRRLASWFFSLWRRAG